MDKCQVRVGDAWHQHDCGKPSVELIDDRPFCKPHAAGRKRSLAATEKRNQQIATETANRREWEARMNVAAIRLGVSATLDYSVLGSRYTESVVISLAEFEQLAERIKRAEGKDD